MVNSDLKLERKLWSEGNKFIIGIDEAGRGPWAGPVVAGAVCFPLGSTEELELKDSKKLNEKKKEQFFNEIKRDALGFGVGIVSAYEIDQIGIQFAVQNAMLEAVHKCEMRIGNRADILIVDGNNVLDIGNYNQKRIVKGDQLHYSISAASILAKVTRDRIMVEMDKVHPEYGFQKHKGYGTKLHKENLDKHGPCSEHRLTYKPVKEVATKFSFAR